MQGDVPETSRQVPPASARKLRPLSDAGLSDDAIWALLDALPDGLILADEGGLIQLVNRQAEELFGYDRGELLGRSVDDLLPEQLRQVHRAHRTRYRVEPRVRAMGADLALFGRRADGTDFPVEISLSPMKTDSGVRIIAAVREISERIALETHARGVADALDATHDGVFILDADTLRFTYVNQGAVHQVGYARDELLRMGMLHIAPEFDEARLRALLTPFERGEVFSTTFTTVHRHRDGSDVPVEITLEARPDDHGRPQSYVEVVRDISQRLEADERIRRAEQDLRLFDDRERIARDLHDRVIQRLFAAGLTLQGAQTRRDHEDMSVRVGTVIDDLDDTIRELRSVIFGLQSNRGSAGVRSELLRVVSEERLALGFEPRVRFDGPIEMVSDSVAGELIATVREALSNVARHAHASSVDIDVECRDTDVVVRVLDDGVGIPANGNSNGNGIRNLTARASMLGGRCRIEARPDRGTVVEWTVPNSR